MIDSLPLLDSRAAAVEALHAATAIYTQAAVVDGMLARLNWAHWARSGGRLLDPSAGDGTFLVQALSQIDLPPGSMDAVSRVLGIEIYPGAVRDARRRVAEHLRSRGWSEAAASIAAQRVVREGDFLLGDVPGDIGRFEVIAGNPPYIRMANLPDEFKALYGSILPGYTLPDVLYAFLDRVKDYLTPEGVIALVTSDRWLFNENAVRLREEIGRRLGISHLARLDVETAFYRPKSRRKGTPPRIHPVEVHFCSAGAAPIRLDARPISADDQTVLPGESGLTLGDIAEVNIAPWLGPEGVFVLNSEAARRIPGAELIPVIDTDDIGRASDTLLAPKRFVLFTAPNAEPEGAVAEHILSRRHLLPEQARKSSRWWLPPEKIVPERIGHDRLLIPRIARRLRVIDLPAGVAVMNHNLTVASPNHGISLGELRAILESPESQAWIARNAPRLENDFYSITTKMLRRLPVRRSSGAHSPELLAA